MNREHHASLAALAELTECLCLLANFFHFECNIAFLHQVLPCVSVDSNALQQAVPLLKKVVDFLKQNS